MSNNVSLKQLNDDLERLEKEAANNITLAGDKEDLERLRIQFLGKKGRLSKILGLMGALKGAAVVCLPFSKKLDSLVPALGAAASISAGNDLVSAVESVLSARSELNEHVENLQDRSQNNVEIIELLDGTNDL